MTKPTVPQPERFPWLPILVLGFASSLAVAIELSPAELLRAIAAELDVSVVAVGTLTTFYALGNALLVLPLTALAIRFTRRTALNVVIIVFVASNHAVALAPTIAIADGWTSRRERCSLSRWDSACRSRCTTCRPTQRESHASPHEPTFARPEP